MSEQILRYTAFAGTPDGGNPAGVVLDATGWPDRRMQAVAADLGYSETAFLTPTAPGAATVRYFAPIAEVDFCGHATIAAAVAHAELFGPGDLLLQTNIGAIPVRTSAGPDGIRATLTSIVPEVTEVSAEVQVRLLAALRLGSDDLDPDLPVRVSYSGNHHPVVAVTAAALDRLDYDFDALRALMADQGWGATVAVVHRASSSEWLARNPFAPGGVREDPATGSAAAALGGYIRELALTSLPTTVLVRQGQHIGRPGLLIVDIPESGGIAVSGTAVRIPA